MLDFFHRHPGAPKIIRSIADEFMISPLLIEGDYWVSHCLWGMQQCGLNFRLKGGTALAKGWRCIDRFSQDVDMRFDLPVDLNLKSEGPRAQAARKAYFDDLAGKILIPDIQTVRMPDEDDDKARNAGIRLVYSSFVVPGHTDGILLEAGYSTVEPSEPRDFVSWAMERAARIPGITDTRALGIPCFNPEYNFVEKLQAVTRRFRQYLGLAGKSDVLPRNWIRHYYDLYRLLELDRVKDFLGTLEYRAWKEKTVREPDREMFASKASFNLPDPKFLAHFEAEYEFILGSLYHTRPTFKEVIARLRAFSPWF
jgi:hypothetical protein